MTAAPGVVALADPSDLVRSATRELLVDSGVEVGWDVADVSALLDRARHEPPDLVLLDAALLAPADTQPVLQELARRGSAALVVVDGLDSAAMLRVVEAGAIGFVSRDASSAELVNNVVAGLRGEACIPRRLLGSLLRAMIERRREAEQTRERYGRMSRREREVLTHLSVGLSPDQVAQELVLSVGTVRTHVQNILGKLGVHSQIEAVRLAHEHGLVPDDPRRSA